MIELLKPDFSHENEIMRLRDIYLDKDEQIINGSAGLENYSNFKDWKEYVNRLELDPPEGFVKSGTYIVKINGKVIGFCSIRHDLNKYLSEYGGHIGYSISPKERGKGYGTQMLKKILEEANLLGLKEVLIITSLNNISSNKIIVENEGYIIGEIEMNNELYNKYLIEVNNEKE